MLKINLKIEPIIQFNNEITYKTNIRNSRQNIYSIIKRTLLYTLNECKSTKPKRLILSAFIAKFKRKDTYI